jgi:hypothetical protein
MVVCEKCGLNVIRRYRCKECRRLLCFLCMPIENVRRCCDCSIRAPLYIEHHGRRNDRFHDVFVWVMGGIAVYARSARGGKPVHEPCAGRVGRAGVDAQYVDTQYHGGNVQE